MDSTKPEGVAVGASELSSENPSASGTFVISIELAGVAVGTTGLFLGNPIVSGTFVGSTESAGATVGAFESQPMISTNSHTATTTGNTSLQDCPWAGLK